MGFSVEHAAAHKSVLAVIGTRQLCSASSMLGNACSLGQGGWAAVRLALQCKGWVEGWADPALLLSADAGWSPHGFSYKHNHRRRAHLCWLSSRCADAPQQASPPSACMGLRCMGASAVQPACPDTGLRLQMHAVQSTRGMVGQAPPAGTPCHRTPAGTRAAPGHPAPRPDWTSPTQSPSWQLAAGRGTQNMGSAEQSPAQAAGNLFGSQLAVRQYATWQVAVPAQQLRHHSQCTS